MTTAAYKRRKAAGLCVRCECPAEQGKVVCRECREKIKAHPSHAREYRLNLRRALREKRLAAGLCTQCGKKEAVENRACCDTCGQRSRDLAKETRASRRAAGICESCGSRDTRRGRTTCGYCSQLYSGLVSQRYKRRAAAGLCRLCDDPPVEGKIHCEKHDRWICRGRSGNQIRSRRKSHRQLNREYYDRKRKGIMKCLGCGKFGEPGKRYCSVECMEAVNEQ